MEHKKQVEILTEVMRQLDKGDTADAGCHYQLSTSTYTCPDLAQREYRDLFQGHPQMIGLSQDLPEPGSYLTLDDFGTPILATRDKDGKFVKVEARWVLRGFQDTQVWDLQTDSPTATRPGFRLQC